MIGVVLLVVVGALAWLVVGTVVVFLDALWTFVSGMIGVVLWLVVGGGVALLLAAVGQ